jgi:hypothetical protein
MRCKVCNENLTTGESVAKDRITGEFVDVCHRCTGVVNKTLSEYEWDDDKLLLHKED